MGSRRLHFHEEIERRHRGGNEEDRPQNIGLRQGRVQSAMREASNSAAASPLRPGACARWRLRWLRQRRDRRRNRGYAPCRADRRAYRHAPAGANGRRRETPQAHRRAWYRSDTAMISARGTMTSPTCTSCKARTFFSMARSCGETSSSVEGSASASCEIVADRGAAETEQGAQAVEEAWLRRRVEDFAAPASFAGGGHVRHVRIIMGSHGRRPLPRSDRPGRDRRSRALPGSARSSASIASASAVSM